MNALLRPVGDVELVVTVEVDAVRQVELAFAMARAARWLDAPAITREAVHAGLMVVQLS